jgi:GDP/UDP-N,N'-diacetylbacillosamine 2-epimerase (hydrolysing)
MRVGVLTSSRADFGIYLPLVEKLFSDKYFQPEIIAFGTHLSEKFGKTVKEIEKSGFPVLHKLETMPEDDSPLFIAKSISKTIEVFSEFWANTKFDLVFALGDRFEMLGAVLAGSPFNVHFAHIHAGETTLGAIDNAYRHSISLMSKYLFVSTEIYKKRAIEIIQRPGDVFNVGALSIDNLKKQKLYSKEEFKTLFDIDLGIPTILITFHPETVGYQKNKRYVMELIAALQVLINRYQIVITMPNADTEGLMVREELRKFGADNPKVKLVESFGMKGYLSCMKYSRFLLGNTSSAFVEAAFFPKWVISLGARQKGRIKTPNIFTVPILKEEILNTVAKIEDLPEMPPESNIYGDGNTAEKMIEIIKKIKIGNW